MSNLVAYNAIVSDKEIQQALAAARIERSKAFVKLIKSAAGFFKYKPSPVVTSNGVASAL